MQESTSHKKKNAGGSFFRMAKLSQCWKGLGRLEGERDQRYCPAPDLAGFNTRLPGNRHRLVGNSGQLQLIGFEAYSKEGDPMLGTVILVKSHDWVLCLVFYPYALLAFCSLFFFFSSGVLPPSFQINHSCGV